jgi:hypothetical protein
MSDDGKLLGRRPLRDPVLHETLSAILWVAHAISLIQAGKPAEGLKLLELARGCVFKACALAESEPL